MKRTRIYLPLFLLVARLLPGPARLLAQYPADVSPPLTRAAVTWWVDDVQMTERRRYAKKIEPPDKARWNDQIYQVRVFNELVYNTDPNQGNLLITNEWKIVLIDFTRAFRTHKKLRHPMNLLSLAQ